jgi:hypothetical protein
MGLTSYSTYYDSCILERVTRMKGRVEEELSLTFAYVVAKLEVLHQNHGFSKNQVPYIILTY